MNKIIWNSLNSGWSAIPLLLASTFLFAPKSTIAQQSQGDERSERHEEQSLAETIQLNSFPLATPIKFPGDSGEGPISSIQIAGVAPAETNGTLQMTLDPSILEFNEFGDAKVIEAKPSRKLVATWTRECCQNSGTSMFAISSPEFKAKQLFLLVEPAPSQMSRLLIGDSPDAVRRYGGSTMLTPMEVLPLQSTTRPENLAYLHQPLRDDVYMYSSEVPTDEIGGGKLGQISLQGRLSGKATLTNDRNHKSIEWTSTRVLFGSTAMAFHPQPMTIDPVALPDPKNQNRRLFKIVFANPSTLGDVFIVTSPLAIGPHRLIIRKEGMTKWVLPLSVSGLDQWIQLQAGFEQLPESEKNAIVRMSDRVPRNFFHDCHVDAGHVDSISLASENATQETLSQLKDLPKLSDVRIAYTSTLDPTAIATTLENLKSVTNLNLHDLKINNKVMETVARMPSLESLAIYNDAALPITDEGLKLVSESKRLKTLHLGASGATDAGLLHLAKLKKLTNLDLNAPKATTKGAQTLRSSLPNCKVTVNSDQE